MTALKWAWSLGSHLCACCRARLFGQSSLFIWMGCCTCGKRGEIVLILFWNCSHMETAWCFSTMWFSAFRHMGKRAAFSNAWGGPLRIKRQLNNSVFWQRVQKRMQFTDVVWTYGCGSVNHLARIAKNVPSSKTAMKSQYRQTVRSAFNHNLLGFALYKVAALRVFPTVSISVASLVHVNEANVGGRSGAWKHTQE